MTTTATYPTQTAETWTAHCIARLAHYHNLICTLDKNTEAYRNALRGYDYFSEEVAR